MILSNFLVALAELLSIIINLYTWVVIIAALITWVQPNPYNPVVQLLWRLTNPAYRIMRRYIPTVVGGLDIAPIILILILKFIDLFLVRTLLEFAHSL
ncbi:MAG: YggT family protein [Campylobacterales bacterium]